MCASPRIITRKRKSTFFSLETKCIFLWQQKPHGYVKIFSITQRKPNKWQQIKTVAPVVPEMAQCPLMTQFQVSFLYNVLKHGKYRKSCRRKRHFFREKKLLRWHWEEVNGTAAATVISGGSISYNLPNQPFLFLRLLEREKRTYFRSESDSNWEEREGSQ